VLVRTDLVKHRQCVAKIIFYIVNTGHCYPYHLTKHGIIIFVTTNPSRSTATQLLTRDVHKREKHITLQVIYRKLRKQKFFCYESRVFVLQRQWAKKIALISTWHKTWRRQQDLGNQLPTSISPTSTMQAAAVQLHLASPFHLFEIMMQDHTV